MEVDTGAFKALTADLAAIRQDLMWFRARSEEIETRAEQLGYENGLTRARRRRHAKPRPAHLKAIRDQDLGAARGELGEAIGPIDARRPNGHAVGERP